MIGKHLKDYKKAYKADRKANKGSCVKKNRDWKRRWLPFIKYDHDFDGSFFIEIMVHKLHIMLDYYKHGKYCLQTDESRNEIVSNLQEACRLGDLIIADDFCDEAYEFSHNHRKTYTTPLGDGKRQFHIEWDSEENKTIYNKMMVEGEALREKTIDEFFHYVRKHYEEWWD